APLEPGGASRWQGVAERNARARARDDRVACTQPELAAADGVVRLLAELTCLLAERERGVARERCACGLSVASGAQTVQLDVSVAHEADRELQLRAEANPDELALRHELDLIPPDEAEIRQQEVGMLAQRQLAH